MKISRDLIMQTITKCVEDQEVNLPKMDSQILAAVDSIDLVNIILDIEAELENHGVNIKLVSEKTFSKNSPFLTLQTLTNYIEDLIACEKPT